MASFEVEFKEVVTNVQCECVLCMSVFCVVCVRGGGWVGPAMSGAG